MNNKKFLTTTIIAVLLLVIVVVGATYAYFYVDTNNNFGTKKVTATTPKVGSVALNGISSNLSINLTAADMADKGKDTSYYASISGKKTSETTEIVGTATVTGEGTYTCNYTLTVNDNTSSVYDVFYNMTSKSHGQIVLKVNSSSYDFNTANLFPLTINGTMTNLTSSASQNITAQLKVVNKTGVNQTSLAGSNLALKFEVTKFDCNPTA